MLKDAMNISKLPEFAPASVKEELIKLLNITISDELKTEKREQFFELRKKTLYSLCTHPNMESVWRRIKKRKVKQPTFYDDFEAGKPPHLRRMDICRSYASAVFKSLQRNEFSYLAGKERLEKGKQLVNSLNQLANDLDKFDIGGNILDYLELDDLRKLFNITQKPQGDDTRKFIVNYVAYNQSLSDVLRRCSKKLNYEKPYSKISISHVNSVSADAVYFVRELAKWNIKTFGFPLHDIIAMTADIFFPDLNYDEKKVMNTLK
jgi:hypothetical protein